VPGTGKTIGRLIGNGIQSIVRALITQVSIACDTGRQRRAVIAAASKGDIHNRIAQTACAQLGVTCFGKKQNRNQIQNMFNGLGQWMQVKPKYSGKRGYLQLPALHHAHLSIFAGN